MELNLNFIPQNIAPKGATRMAVFNSNGEEVGTIPLGRLTPPDPSKKLYSFGALSDVHLPYSTAKEDFIRAMGYLNDVENVDFICISGDMGSSGVDSEWADFKTHVDTYSPNTPVHLSAGNHDVGQSTPKTYEFPIPYTGNPLYYSFTQGNDVFIMFGSSFWGDPPFSNESLQWLYEILEKNRNKRCFVFEHYLRLDGCGNANKGYPIDILTNTNGQVFLSLMEHYKNVLWFHGHSHSEFEHQDTLSIVNANYDRAFGCHSIHIPSCAMTRNEANSYDYEDSEGYVVDVYNDGIHLRGRDFIAEEFLPIASYWIETTLKNIPEKSYIDTRGVIDTSNNISIVVPDGTTIILNQRYSRTNATYISQIGMVCLTFPFENNNGNSIKLKFDNLAYSMFGANSSLYVLDNNKSNAQVVNGYSDFRQMISGVEVAEDFLSGTVTFIPPINEGYLTVALRINDTNTLVTEEDIKDIIVTLEEE